MVFLDFMLKPRRFWTIDKGELNDKLLNNEFEK